MGDGAKLSISVDSDELHPIPDGPGERYILRACPPRVSLKCGVPQMYREYFVVLSSSRTVTIYCQAVLQRFSTSSMSDTGNTKAPPAGTGGEISPVLSNDHASVEKGSVRDDNFEVFRDDGDVAFRTVGWIWATAIFLKIIFATGVLTIPTAMAALGSFPGAINVLGWQAVNTYSGVLMGDFRNRHAGVHSVADMASIVGGKLLREIIGFLFIITWVIVAASGIVGASTALNALSEHALCTNYFTLIVALVMAGLAAIRKFEHIGWLTWVGFVTIYAAVLIVV